MFSHSFDRLLAIATLISLFATMTVSAQKRRPATPSSTSVSTASTKPKSDSCNAGYSGTVSYSKSVTVASTGVHGSSRSMNRIYSTTISIRDEGQPQGSVTPTADGLIGSFNLYGRADGNETETLNQIDISQKTEYCNVTMKGAGKPQQTRCESKLNRQQQASGTAERANVFLGLNGRTMKLSVGNLPKLSGTVSQESSSSCTGTCTPQNPVGSSSTTEVHNQGERSAATEEGVITFNPESFSRLSGSHTKTSPDGNTVETFNWNLSRCPVKLDIVDIRFEHKRVGGPDQWVGIDPLSGTTDGNQVRIKARIHNKGGDVASANVRFSELKSSEDLPGQPVAVSVKPGEYRDVEFDWNTSGYAWDENQKAESNREIKAEIDGDSETAKIKIFPKPVILVHGLWSNAAAWADYPLYLREVHSFAWKGYAVGADPKNGLMSTGDRPGNYKPTNTIYQNAQELAKQIKFARETNNAWHVDVVAHSMGGLISRQYINTFMQPVFDGRPEVTHLVMLGTPNMGSPCADTMNEGFEETNNNEMHAMRELKPIIVRAFNTRVTERKGVKFSVLIGVIPIPRTCLAEGVFGDGVVPVESAKWNLTDYASVARDHISLTGREDFDGFVLPRIAIGPKKARTEQSVQ